ncbi:MAG: hypothetical protein HC824_04500 [Synechococcales cyanobacterium RM1_1_8]|nr:hypothetical protein [Synechococcales cyanobacterium RM1_1_8]
MSDAARKKQIMEHLSASSKTKLEIPAVAQNPGFLPPNRAVADDKTYSRRMEHVARSLGAFYQKSGPTSAQIIAHLNLTSGQ